MIYECTYTFTSVLAFTFSQSPVLLLENKNNKFFKMMVTFYIFKYLWYRQSFTIENKHVCVLKLVRHISLRRINIRLYYGVTISLGLQSLRDTDYTTNQHASIFCLRVAYWLVLWINTWNANVSHDNAKMQMDIN